MIYDDDELDRALEALPMEESPPGLHARIMAATIYRPAPVVSGWEVWLGGTVIALAAWLIWMLASAPHAGERLGNALTQGLENAGLTSSFTIVWLAVGISAAWWLSQLSIPASRRIRAR